jgi:2-desacetyl-2-hydroxyethyl bacteriochlorophyllide A dehydrogenase
MNERPTLSAPNPAYDLTVEGPGRIGRDFREPAPLAANEVRIATLFSGISAGTEMTAFFGSNPFLNRRWDPQARIFVDGNASWTYPMAAMGYEEVGRIVEVGPEVTKVQPGQVVWGTWRHRSEHVADEDWAAVRILPESVDPRLGIFSQIGAIALNAVVDANIHLGEFVAIFGQGVPGLMVTQLARLNGATVIAVDRLASRLEHAKALGAAHVLDATEGDVAARIKAITGGRGADVSIEISGAWPALHEAIRSTAYNSRVVACGFFQGDGQGLRLGEEFHHNRIDLVCSQISGLNPSLDHRWDRARLDRTVMGLIAEGRVDFGRLISHTIAASRAQEAFDMLRDRPADCLQVVLDFQE